MWTTTGLKNSCVFPIDWSAQHAIPQSHNGQFVAGTEEQIWNGRIAPQGRLLSSLAKHPALPVPQHYQNMHIFLTNKQRERQQLCD